MAKSIEYTAMTEKSRRGSNKSNSSSVQQVAGCIPLNMIDNKILLISSRDNEGSWLLPEGEWGQDEHQQDAAQLKTWQKAGIKGTITKHLGVFEERLASSNDLKAHHSIFEMRIKKVVQVFPALKEQERRWFTFEEALLATQGQYHIQEAIMCSSLNPARRSAPTPPKHTCKLQKELVKLEPLPSGGKTNDAKIKSYMKSLKYILFNKTT